MCMDSEKRLWCTQFVHAPFSHGLQNLLHYLTLVLCPDPTHKRRESGDVQPISQVSLLLITFWGEISVVSSCKDHEIC